MNGFITHARSGLRINPNTGVVIGRSGRYVGAPGAGGYLVVAWKEGNRIQGGKVHRLVWEVANGPIPDGKEINHVNGIKSDNRITNLEVVSRLENMRHAYATGLNKCFGERNGRAKLTPEQVSEIIARHSAGETARGLAKEFGVGETAVGKIVRGERWTKARAA